jgi:hypothetical protein
MEDRCLLLIGCLKRYIGNFFLKKAGELLASSPRDRWMQKLSHEPWLVRDGDISPQVTQAIQPLGILRGEKLSI